MDWTGPTAAISATDRPASDFECFPLDQRLGDGPAGGGQHAREGRARHAHACCRLFLVQPLQIGQPQGLETVESQLDLLELGHRDALRLECALLEPAPDLSCADWACHRRFSI
jgi:hypothetical protein